MVTQQNLFTTDADHRMTATEFQTWLASATEPWVDGYLQLRQQGVAYRDAVLATWLSLRRDDRGGIKTRDDLANLLGVSRVTTYQWEARRPEIREYVERLHIARLRGERMAEVDEATYQAAVAADSSAADRKLFYQRAGVWDENSAADEPETAINIILDRA